MPLIAMPTTPPAPASIEFSETHFAAMNLSPFTGQQQIQDWQADRMECVVNLPPMPQATASAWVSWLRSMSGVVNTTQFGSSFASAYSNDLGSRTWRLKNNTNRWSVSELRMYGVQFELMEVL